MSSSHPVRWLRASYWAGAIADIAMVILFLQPRFMGEDEYRYAMGAAAVMMLGWTLLLLWADRKPVARKGILLLTIIPVITGLLAVGIYSAMHGLKPFSLTALVLGVTLITLMGYSYYNARDLR